MNVTLLAYTPQPEKTVACAAKLCYSGSSVDQLYDGLTQEKAEDFVEMLAEIGHESPIEHASFTFALEGVSRSLAGSDHTAPAGLLQRPEPAVCERIQLFLRDPAGNRGGPRGQ